MKKAADFMAEANAAVTRIPGGDAVQHHGADNAVFIDVRDSGMIANTGTIAGALRIPRGMMEFVADEDTPFYHPALKKQADIYLVCGAGGMAALAGKTLKDMGYESVINIGGFGEWQDAGGPTEDA